MEFEVYSRVACRTLIFYTTAKNSGHVGYLWCDCDGGEKWEGRLCFVLMRQSKKEPLHTRLVSG